MNDFRDLKFDDPHIKALYTNKRIRGLKQYIIEHECAKEIDGDYDSDDEKELLLSG